MSDTYQIQLEVVGGGQLDGLAAGLDRATSSAGMLGESLRSVGAGAGAGLPEAIQEMLRAADVADRFDGRLKSIGAGAGLPEAIQEMLRAAEAADHLGGNLRGIGGAIAIEGGDPFASLEAGAIRLEDRIEGIGAADPLRGLESGLRQGAAEVGQLDDRLRGAGAAIKVLGDPLPPGLQSSLGVAAAEARLVEAAIHEALGLQSGGNDPFAALDSGMQQAAADARLLSAAEHELGAAGDRAARGQEAVAHAEGKVAQAASQAAGATGKAAAAGRAAGAAGHDAGKGATKAAMGFLEVSRAVEDAQYGLAGVVNNIPGIVMDFGSAAGLSMAAVGGITAAVSLAAVAANQLYNHWGDISDRFKANWSGSTVEQLREIRETAEEAAKAFEHLQKTAPKARQEEAKLVSEAITEGPTKDIAERFTRAIGKSDLRAVVKEEAPQVGAMAPGVIPRAGRSRAEAEKEATEADKQKAQELLGAATLAGDRGDAARKALADLAAKAGDPRLLEFLEKLKAATPEQQEARKDDQANREATVRGRDKARDAEKGRVDEAVSALSKSDIARAVLEPGGKSQKDLIAETGEALKAAGMEGVESWRVLVGLQEKLNKLARDKALSNGTGIAGGRAAVLDDMDKEADRDKDRERAEQARDRDRMREEQERARERRTDQAVGGLAESPLARAMLAGGRGDFVGATKQALGRAGASDVNPLAAFSELKEKLDKQVEARALAEGVDRRTARAMVLEDFDKKHQGKDEKRGAAEFVGVADFAKRMQSGILDKDNVPKQQLEQSRMQTASLNTIAKQTKKAPVAVAGK